MTTFSLLLFEAEATHYAVWIAVITAFGGIILAIVNQYFPAKINEKIIAKDKEIDGQKRDLADKDKEIESLKIQLQKVSQEVDIDSKALSFPKFLEVWNEVGTRISTLFERTKTTRFLVLRAWNGYESPRFTTAIIQYRNRQVERSDFIHFKLDDDYIERLLKMKSRDSLEMATKDLGNSLIGDIYRNEQPPVSFARWKFISAEKIDTNRQIITYCSFATESDLEFTQYEKLEQDKVVNLIQQCLEK